MTSINICGLSWSPLPVWLTTLNGTKNISTPCEVGLWDYLLSCTPRLNNSLVYFQNWISHRLFTALYFLASLNGVKNREKNWTPASLASFADARHTIFPHRWEKIAWPAESCRGGPRGHQGGLFARCFIRVLLHWKIKKSCKKSDFTIMYRAMCIYIMWVFFVYNKQGQDNNI